MSNEKKINKAKKGNSKAFEELISEEKNKLFRVAFLYVKDEDLALDIVQETIYKAFVSIKQLKETQYFSTWITKILINTALDFIRKNNRLNIVPFSDIERFNLNHRINLVDKLDLVEAIERLEEQYKTVIVLRYYKDLTIKQISEALGCPEGTVKARLHRAINRLKSDLKEGCI
jgi:RNA polymerase sigma-70 factor, ECF subfamily